MRKGLPIVPAAGMDGFQFSFNRVYLGVNTCEVFLCFLAIIFLGSIVLTSHQWLLCIHCFYSTSLVSFTGFYTEDETFNPRFTPRVKRSIVWWFQLFSLWFHFFGLNIQMKATF